MRMARSRVGRPLVVDACSAISRWYEKRKIPVEWYSVEVSDGILELNLEEPRIGEVEIRFIDRKTGEPIKGATRSTAPLCKS